MKRFLPFLLLAGALHAQTTPVSGTIQAVNGQPAGPNSYVEFTLVNCGTTQPTVNGVAIMLNAPVDFYPDANGNLQKQDGSPAALYGNDQISCGNIGSPSRYSVQQLPNGQPAGPAKLYFVQSGVTFNLNTAQPIFVLPPLKYPNPTKCPPGQTQTGLNNDLSVVCSNLPSGASNAVIVNPNGTQIVDQPAGSILAINGSLNSSQTNITFHSSADVSINSLGCLGTGTPLECTIAKANAWAATNSGIASAYVDCGQYTITHQIVLAVTGSSRVVIQGCGNAQATITYAGTSLPAGQAVITQANGSFVRGSLSGFRLNVKNLADYGIGVNAGFTDMSNLIVTGANVANYNLSGNTIEAHNLASIVDGSISQGHAAGFIATMSGGSVASVRQAAKLNTITVTAGGSGYTAPVASWAAGCAVNPIVSFGLSGGSITSASVSQRGFCPIGTSLTVTDATGSGATFTPTFFDPTGSGFTPANTKAYFLQGGCAVQPTGTLSFGGAAPTNVTGLTITNPGSGCTGQVFIQIIDQPVLPQDFKIGGTDNRFYDLYAAAGYYGLNITGDENRFFGTHCFYVDVCFTGQNGGSEFYGLELDSVRIHAADLLFYTKMFGVTETWDGNDAYPGSQGLVLLSNNARTTLVDGWTCSNNPQGGGYIPYTDSTSGPVDSTNLLFTSDMKHFTDCTSTQQVGSAPSPLADYTSVRTYFNGPATFNNSGIATASQSFSSQFQNWAASVWDGVNLAPKRYQFGTQLTHPSYGLSLLTTVPTSDSVVPITEFQWNNPTPASVSTTNASPQFKWSANAFDGATNLLDYWQINTKLLAGANADSYLVFSHGGSSGHNHIFWFAGQLLSFGTNPGAEDTNWFRCAAQRICVGSGAFNDTTGGFRGRFHEWVSSNGSAFIGTVQGAFSAARAFTWPDISGTVQVNSEADITWSATPALNPLASVNYIVVAGATAPTIPSGTAGQCFDLQAAENATGGFSWTWPANTTVSSQAVAFVTTGNALNYYRACWNVLASKWFIK